VERDERNLADDLDRHWDAVLRGDAASASVGLDADLAALVGRLWVAGRALPSLFPDPGRAWRELQRALTLSSIDWSDDGRTLPTGVRPDEHLDRLAERRSTPRPPRRWGVWLLTQLATAALLLLTLAIGFAAVSLSVPKEPDAARWVPALVRALAAAPEGVVDTPLIETTFKADELPSKEKEAIYYKLTIPPGASLPYLGGPYCGCHTETVTKGVGAEIVQSGAYTLRLQAPLTVQRAGPAQQREEIPAGDEVTLTAGDAVIYPDYAASGDIRNGGDVPVTLIGVAIVATDDSGTPLPKLPTGIQATLLTHSIPSDWAPFPPGPLNVSLRQVTLPAETTIGPYEPVGLQAFQVESGTILRNFVPPGEATAPRRPLTQLPGATASFMRPAPGLREILSNDGKKPAQFLVLIIEPGGISAQSLAP
jgi:hypothetical protein